MFPHRSEAQQRAGRAGRTSAGKCFRIYSKDFWDTCMPEYTIPEIQRTSLTSVILTLKCLGIHDVIRYCWAALLFLDCLTSLSITLIWPFLFFNYDIFRFPFLDCPEERFILTALKQLYQFDAIDRWVICILQTVACYLSTLQETAERVEYFSRSPSWPRSCWYAH